MVPITFSAKRVYRPIHSNEAIRTHEDTIRWAEEAETTGDHSHGIIGQSVLMDFPRFDVVKDLVPEPMHLLDMGFMKNICGRIFNSGTAPQTKRGYKRSPTGKLSQLLR